MKNPTAICYGKSKVSKHKGTAMKRLYMTLIAMICYSMAVNASHAKLDTFKKFDFAQKRLTMMKTHLQTKLGELLQLEGTMKSLSLQDADKVAL